MARIKSIIAGIASISAIIFYALFQRQKSIASEIESDQAKKQLEAERKANQAMIDGIGYEAGIISELENKPFNRTDID